VPDSEPGKADINHGIPSKDNPRFLLHDSQGFEHGEDNTVSTVRNFIQSRNREPKIKDKLHAIWYAKFPVDLLHGLYGFLFRLCLEIPTAGGRLLETGVEDFLKLKTAEELGKGK
jgi:hypothetical protein